MSILDIDEFRQKLPSWTTEEILAERDKCNGWPDHLHAIHLELNKRMLAAVREQIERLTREVGILSSSSNRLEDLTKTLKNLTWALICLTVAAIAVPIGIEVWKAKHEPKAMLVSEPVKPAQ